MILILFLLLFILIGFIFIVINLRKTDHFLPTFLGKNYLYDPDMTSHAWTSPASDTYSFSVSAIDVWGFESQPSSEIIGVAP